jgi:hypothetical protein
MGGSFADAAELHESQKREEVRTTSVREEVCVFVYKCANLNLGSGTLSLQVLGVLAVRLLHGSGSNRGVDTRTSHGIHTVLIILYIKVP